MDSTATQKLLKGLVQKFYDTLPSTICGVIQRGFITGGCIPSLLMGSYYNDIDIYLKNEHDVKLALDYFQKEYDNADDNYTKQKFHVTLITDNSINFSDKIQIITRWYGKPEAIIDKFDFAHLQSWYDIFYDRLYIDDQIYPLLLHKKLVYTGSMFPLSSLLRTRKFISRGWRISTPDLVRIALEIHSYFNMAYSKGVTYYEESMIENDYPGFDNEEVEQIYTDMDKQMIDVNELTRQLNGVDPLTIQAELASRSGTSLSIGEVIDLIS